MTFLLFGAYNAFGQQVCGFVEDAESGERLPYASVFSLDSKSGVTTNNFGYFSIKSNKGINQLQIRYTGYIDLLLTLPPFKDTTLVVKLISNNRIEEIKVVGKISKYGYSSGQIGRIEIPIKQLQTVPALFGEPDIMKILQLYPGIQSTKSGFSSLVVRQ